MAVGFSNTNKPLNPRGLDASPKGYNRAALYSGKALDFDGVNDEVNCGDINVAFSEISFAFHFNADSFSNNCIFQKESVFRFIGVNTNQIDIVLATTGNSWYSKKMTLTNLESKDYFLVATYNGSELKAYLNGVLVDTLGGYSGSVASVSQNVYIGRTNAGLYYNGKISGARIFNTALTAAQVSDLYNNPEKIVPTGVDNTALKLWLPMMEGAGTTAYDGSGNGNHGTISGATYVHGVGAPVSQTAVIDWNKGSNYYPNSNDFSQWAPKSGTFAQGEADPFGGNQAWSLTATNTDPYIYQTISTAGDYTLSFWAKGIGSTIGKDFLLAVPGTDGSFTLTSEWVRYEHSFTLSVAAIVGFEIPNPAVVGDVVHIFGAQVNEGSTAGPYIPTLSTAQTTPVLLPQGLTSGRDITGVNLFENVRKQGALNLDGNSWAEVHDNASLDITAFSVEAWAYPIQAATGAGEEIFGKYYGSSQPYNSYGIEWLTDRFRINYGDTSNVFNTINAGSSQALNNWHHIVGTYDGANFKIYINGSESNSVAKTSSVITGDGPVYIGTWGGAIASATQTFDGPIAQPRIYNRALTASEVLRNYNSGKSTYQ